ncbi:MAG: hypothetical protein M1840_007456 [Geoglossum simile]|nr:MAG: hypothetical protein M1840_007456 [Geoglossum simile]
MIQYRVASSSTHTSKIRIFSDSQSALQSICSWRAGACQEVVAEIIKKFWMNDVTLYWIPSHAGITGNVEADKLAKAATRSKNKKPLQRDGHPWYLMTQALKDAGITARRLLSGRSNVGSFTKKIDAALYLGKSAELYQQLTSSEAAILTQL